MSTPTLRIAVAAFIALAVTSACGKARPERPNILWVMAEDLSAEDLPLYGNTICQTPNLDRFATEGVTYENTFTTAGLCSPSRTAMITGVYQMRIGGLNQRCQHLEGKGMGAKKFWPSYTLPEPLDVLPAYLRQAGYFTANQNVDAQDRFGPGKTDFNFLPRSTVFDGENWQERSPDQPFFQQFTITTSHTPWPRDPNRPIPPEAAKALHPIHPDDPVILGEMANYMEAVQVMDRQFGDVLRRLDEEGLSDNTVVIFIGDNGRDYLRSKFYVYDSGIHIPMVIRWPGKLTPGTKSGDMVSAIDITATILGIAGVEVPEHFNGRDFLAPDAPKREYVFAGTDRYDHNFDLIRTIRDRQFQYIRNFMPFRPYLAQRYVRGTAAGLRFMELAEAGKLTPFQASYAKPRKPFEELYDLSKDPFQMKNLAADPAYRERLEQMRALLKRQMIDIDDLGLIPESELEEMGLAHGSRYAILQTPENEGLVAHLWEVIDRGQKGEAEKDYLLEALVNNQPSVRYWAAVYLGEDRNLAHSCRAALRKALQDPNPTVRIGAARAVYQMGDKRAAVATLSDALDDENHAVRFLALTELYWMGEDARPALEAIQNAPKVPGEPDLTYEYVRRMSEYIQRDLGIKLTHITP